MIESIAELQAELDKNPPEDIIEKNNSNRYVPIQHQEAILNRLFSFANWKSEVISERLIENELVFIVRLWFRVPNTSEWMFRDGTGASSIQQDSGTPIPEWKKFKKYNSCEMAYPKGASYAFSNACKKLGNCFGANVSKKRAESNPNEYKENSDSPATAAAMKKLEVIEEQLKDIKELPDNLEDAFQDLPFGLTDKGLFDLIKKLSKLAKSKDEVRLIWKAGVPKLFKPEKAKLYLNKTAERYG